MKNIHLLPTDKPSRLCYVICTEKSTLTLFEDEMEKGKRFFPQHIYITSNEEIKEGDWFLHQNSDKINIFKSREIVGKSIVVGDKKESSCWIDYSKKIILTTDPDLIKDGVQSIDDEFLEWFVRNPSCKDVDTSWYTVSDKRVYKIIIPKEESKQEQDHCNFCGKTLKEQMKGCTEITCYRQFLPKQDIIQSNEDAEIFIENIINPAEPNEALKKAKQRYSKQETLEQAADNWSLHEKRSKWGEIVKNSFKAGANWQAERMYSKEEVMDIINSFEKLCYKYQSNKDWFPAKKSEWFEQFKKK
jgi:hypothetical protein